MVPAIGSGSKGWTTEDQKMYLENKIPSFLAAKKARTKGVFFSALYLEWAQKWTLPPPTPRDIEQNLTDVDRTAKQEVVSIFY